jgi:hypothetical protein
VIFNGKWRGFRGLWKKGVIFLPRRRGDAEVDELNKGATELQSGGSNQAKSNQIRVNQTKSNQKKFTGAGAFQRICKQAIGRDARRNPRDAGATPAVAAIMGLKSDGIRARV